MRKEYVVFFVMFGIAAMLTGFTVGFVANYQFINEAIQTGMAQQEQIASNNEKEKAPEHKAAQTSVSDSESTAPAASKVASTTAAAASSTPAAAVVTQAQLDGSVLNIPLSVDDVQSVNDMLDALNVDGGASESDRIRNFQSQTGIAPTGELDSYTLNAIIQQVTVKYAQRSLYGG